MNNRRELPYIDFYKKHKIAPVSQDITDLQKHFSRRSALYRSLGMLPGYFKDKTLLEFGPGCGHNALFTKSLAPRKYVLVDANPVGLEATKSLLKKYPLGSNKCEVVESLIEEYRSEDLFDVVFCENLIPYQLAPLDFLKHVASFVKPRGVLVITCQDSGSLLSEILRNLIRVLVVNPEDSMEKNLKILRPIFIPHLASLKNMTRPIDDWILDQVIQPISGDLMSIQEAIHALDPEFEIYGSSPKFLTDWRWYKAIPEDNKYNEMAINLANQYTHNLLDYRFTYPPQSSEINNNIRFLCDGIFALMKKIEVNCDMGYLEELNGNLKSLSGTVRKYSPETAASLEDFVAAMEHYLFDKSFPQLKEFVPFFGRGTQYLSFTKAGVSV